MKRSPHLLAASAGAGLFGGVLLLPLLPAGGLAPLLLAAGVAVTLGALGGMSIWRSALPAWSRLPVDLAMGAWWVAWLRLVDGPVSPWGGVAVVGIALLAARWAGLVGALAAVGALGVGSAALWLHPDDSLLLPRFADAGAWVPAATVAGVALAGAGSWLSAEPRRPGDRGTPWLTAGTGILFALGLASASAAAYAGQLGAATVDALTQGWSWLGLGATAAAWAAAPAGVVTGRARGWGAAVAAALAVLLPRGVAEGLGTSVAPLLVGGVLGVASLRVERRERWGIAAAGVTLALGGGLAFRAPASVTDGVLLGLVIVAGVWVCAWPRRAG